MNRFVIKTDPMTKSAFTMKLKPGFEQEYKKRHDEIWPEMVETLKGAGISDFSIYLDKATLTLFAVRKIENESLANELHNDPVVKKWWAYMADIMDTNPDNSPVELPLQEVFHLD